MKILILIGPTGSGKSNLALEVAKNFRCEIVNADSRQMYRGLDIGTAKPTANERQTVAHHLYDILEPDEVMSAGEFARRANKIIPEIIGRGAYPLFVGGTGFYVRALTEGLSELGNSSPEIKARLRAILKRRGLSVLWNMLKRNDPETASRLHPNDTQRILRALEVYFSTGKSLSSHFEKNKPTTAYDFLKIGLTLERQILYQRIDERVEKMLKNGWLDEVRSLLEKGLNAECRAFEAIGYRQIARWIKAGGDFEAVVSEIKKEHRNYAKRQMTWFKKEKDIKWFDAEDRDKTVSKIVDYVRTGFAGQTQGSAPT